ncbi:MAG: binary toxin-like calcium binding domain-containing protein [Candidatus Syntropharchaeales archaeon]
MSVRRRFVVWLLAISVMLLLVSGIATSDQISDPLIKDSDGDGMPDDWELEYGLDPMNPDDASLDYNDDGLSNLEEYERKANPIDRDVDDDRIDNLAEQEGLLGFVTDPFAKDTDGDGLDDLEELAGYIDDMNGSQMRWVDIDIEELIGLKEDFPWTLDPLNPDTDGDGIEDGEEVDKYDFDPDVDDSTVDLDCDGLDNIREINLTTDYDRWDTDGDGLSDGMEVLGTYGIITDPKKVDTDSDGVDDMEEVVGIAPIPPSEHVLTFEEFIRGSAYAGEYVTMKAKVNRVRTSKNFDEYWIDLKSLDSDPGVCLSGDAFGVVHVGNAWHRDWEHGNIFTDDSFDITLMTDDIIIITGNATRKETTTRIIEVNTEGSGGSIFLILDPHEKRWRWIPSENKIIYRTKFAVPDVKPVSTIEPGRAVTAEKTPVPVKTWTVEDLKKLEDDREDNQAGVKEKLRSLLNDLKGLLNSTFDSGHKYRYEEKPSSRPTPGSGVIAGVISFILIYLYLKRGEL